jgi:hypothetical protein
MLNLTWDFSEHQLYILLVGTTLTSLAILLTYFEQKKKKKRDEDRVCLLILIFLHFDCS